MMKVVYVLRIIAAILVVGTVGSIEIDRIDLWTGMCQGLLGITLWLLTGYWIEELKEYKRCSFCNKRIKGPYTNWSYLTGKPRIVCDNCKDIHPCVNRITRLSKRA